MDIEILYWDFAGQKSFSKLIEILFLVLDVAWQFLSLNVIGSTFCAVEDSDQHKLGIIISKLEEYFAE